MQVVWYRSGKCTACQHLFFNCAYSKTVWSKVLSYLNTLPQVTAQRELELAIKRARSTKDRSKVFVMMYTKSLYAIWLQRNAKFFRNSDVNPNQLVRNIIFRIACRCSEKQKAMLVL